MQEPIALDPLQEDPPSCVMDRFGKLAVLDHILELSVFIGNQVARRDQRVCHLSGKIFTLPLDFQMLLGQSFFGLLPISRFLVFTGKSSLEELEFLLCFAVVLGVLNSIAFRRGQVCFQTDINAQLSSRWGMLDFALGLDAKRCRIAINSSDKAYSLDVLDGEGFDALLLVPNQTETAYTTTICEGEVTTIRLKLPSIDFVFHRAVVVLKLGIAFLSRFLLFAIVIEARDSKPCTVSTGLTSLSTELPGKGIFLSKNFTVGLQVVFGDILTVHPQSQRFVADELDNADGLVNGGILLFVSIHLILIDQHALLLAFLLLLNMIFHRCQDLSIERLIVQFGCLSHLLQQTSRKPNGECLLIIFHSSIVVANCNYIKRVGSLCFAPAFVAPLPFSRRGRAIHPS
jgi:hypothetical protein